jgi:hypothetical protein
MSPCATHAARWAFRDSPNDARLWLTRSRRATSLGRFHQSNPRAGPIVGLLRPGNVGYCLGASEVADKRPNVLQKVHHEFEIVLIANLLFGYASDRQGQWSRLEIGYLEVAT